MKVTLIPYTRRHFWPTLTPAQTLYLYESCLNKPKSEVCKKVTLPFDMSVASSSGVFMIHAATHTESRTDADDRYTDATAVGVSKYADVHALFVGVRDVSEASSSDGQSSTHRSVSIWRQQWPGLRHQSKVVDQHVVTLITVLQEETVAQRVVSNHVFHLDWRKK